MELTAVCPLKACKKSGECVRYANFLKAKAEKDEYMTINPERVHPDDNGCEHWLVERKVKVAYGFKKLYSTLPVNKAKWFWVQTGLKSESTYYRYKRGEYGLGPRQQAALLENFCQHGADISVGFDRYQMESVFVNPRS